MFAFRFLQLVNTLLAEERVSADIRHDLRFLDLRRSRSLLINRNAVTSTAKNGLQWFLDVVRDRVLFLGGGVLVCFERAL